MIILEYEGKNEAGCEQYTRWIGMDECKDKAAVLRRMKKLHIKGVFLIFPDRKKIRVGPKEVKTTETVAEEID